MKCCLAQVRCLRDLTSSNRESCLPRNDNNTPRHSPCTTMPRADEVTDPSDWLPTNLPFFAPLDSALRCQVCKEFYNTPMITSCSHTFCSLCIRRCLSADGKCPACRQTDQPSKLRVNGTVQELVDAFGAARPQGLKVGLKAKQETEEGEEEGQPRRKRRKVDKQEKDATPARQTRQTRSSGRRANGAALSQDTTILDSDDDDVEEYYPEPEPKEPNDGLVACPMCETRMKEPLVYAHLDRCDGKVALKSRYAHTFVNLTAYVNAQQKTKNTTSQTTFRIHSHPSLSRKASPTSELQPP